MRTKTKNALAKAFVIVIAIAIVLALCLRFTTTAEVSAVSLEQLSVSYNTGTLTVSVPEGIADYQYQFWIKTKVVTDNNIENSVFKQEIWQLRQEYSTASLANITVTEDNLFDGGYQIIVRIKNAGGVFVKEVLGSYTPHNVNQVNINSISIGGNIGETLFVVDKSAGTVAVNVYGNGVANTAYSLYNGNTLLASNTTGIFNLDISAYPNGLYEITVVADNALSRDEKIAEVYIYGDYIENQVAVIKSLTGTSTTAGVTTFTMELTYADGSNIPAANIVNFDLSLVSDSTAVNYTSASNNADTGILEVLFNVDYTNDYGIYYTTGTVSRDGLIKADDNIIIYYNGYARAATLTQTATVSNIEKYTAATGSTIEITSSGTIIGSTENLLYAYYREDASGWVLIQDYSTDNTFSWNPAKSGTYIIQSRIKENGQGSYEKAISKIYEITGDKLTGGLVTTIYDYNTKNIYTGDLETGKPYKIVADYSGIENVLFMFTVYNANTLEIYLNKYSVSNSVMFVPNKSDEFIITARAISVSGYGYKDISTSTVLKSSEGAEFVNRNFAANETLPLWTVGSDVQASIVNDAPDNKTAIKIVVSQWDGSNSTIALSSGIIKKAMDAGYTTLGFKYYATTTDSLAIEGNPTNFLWITPTAGIWKSMTITLSKIGYIDWTLGTDFKIGINGTNITLYIADLYFFNADKVDLNADLVSDQLLPIWQVGSYISDFKIVNDAPDNKTALKMTVSSWNNVTVSSIILNSTVLANAKAAGYTQLCYMYYASNDLFIQGFPGNWLTSASGLKTNVWTRMTINLSDCSTFGIGINGTNATIYISDMYFFNIDNVDIASNLVISQTLPIWSAGSRVTYFNMVDNAPGSTTALKMTVSAWNDATGSGMLLNSTILSKAKAAGYNKITFKYYTDSATQLNIEGYNPADGNWLAPVNNTWTSVTIDFSKISAGAQFRISKHSNDSSTVYISDVYFTA